MRSRLVALIAAPTLMTAGALGAATFSAQADTQANPPYAISAGGQTSGTASYTASTSPIAFYTDFVDMSCASGGASGGMQLGSDADGLDVGTVETDESDWVGCKGPLNLDMVVHPTTPWQLNLTGPAGGVTNGYVDDISAYIVAIDPSTGLEDPTLCSFTAEGSAFGQFDEATQELAVQHTPANAANVADPLEITSATGCANQVVAGDAAYFEATYAVSSTPGPIDIN